MNLAYYTKYYFKILGSLEQNLYGISIIQCSSYPFYILIYYKLVALCKVSYKIET